VRAAAVHALYGTIRLCGRIWSPYSRMKRPRCGCGGGSVSATVRDSGKSES